jgi:TRAP transporter TAXI family solute receptor
MTFLRAFVVALVAAPFLIGAAGCGGDGGGDGGRERLSVATGGTAGVYYPLGGGLARVITRHVEGVEEATAEVTSASVDNMRLIGNGDADLAFVLGDTASDAVEGREQFEEPIEACAISRLYDNFTQVVTTAGSGISSIEALEGKRVSLGSPGSGTEVIALRILAAAGVDPEGGIEKASLSLDESVSALRDGTIDAFFWSGGLPTGGIVDLASTERIVVLPTGEYNEALRSEYGEFYEDAEIPAGTYEGQDQAVPTQAVPNVLVASPDMDEDLQRDLAAVLFERKADLEQVHPEAKNIRLETAEEVGFMDICPGAQRYFEEARG